MFTLLGHKVAVPFGVAPTAMQRMAHNEGEVATARVPDGVSDRGCATMRGEWSAEAVEAWRGVVSCGLEVPGGVRQLGIFSKVVWAQRTSVRPCPASPCIHTC
ncbi:hypothetical protein O3P69_002813 [Scylla paramamosain]|uniref:FMN-dependent dehydrogenase domain-containing protein n=1 Tax=Scylla paramamosain TaxID=85552 RepID=A0AAW0UNM5_SCYPA